ncbi:MAG: hypothetical protein CRN43_02890 [Candidatus Nephrothrix sp. EaCA]|nr:MAG: hypothetical protein CRN43_02890 [Candidatus Nephrothrix sp. EaCA]
MIAVALLMLVVLFKDSQGVWLPILATVLLFSIQLLVYKLNKQMRDAMLTAEIDDNMRNVKRMLSQALTVVIIGSILVFPGYFGVQYFNLLMVSWLVMIFCKVYFLSPKSLVVNAGKSIRVPLLWKIEWKLLRGFKLDESNGMIFFPQSLGGQKVKISKTDDLERLVESLQRMGIKKIEDSNGALA